MPPRVLIAFDKFKDALTAEHACSIAAAELQRLHPAWQVHCAPLTDGGDGFCRVLTQAAGGELRTVVATGPLGTPVEAPLGLVDTRQLRASVLTRCFPNAEQPPRRLAVIEMAAVNGLAQLAPEHRDPWRTTTVGTGELILAAAGFGADAVLLGVGGSATSDLGLGALHACGLEFRDARGALVTPPVPALWHRIASINGSVSARVPPIIIACDVSNPLLGEHGAAAVFGRQKGLRPADLPRHEALASRMAAIVCGHVGADPNVATRTPGAGAAGGITFGLTAAAGARMVPGFDLVAEWLDLDARIREADIVITGEGRFDASSLSGKGPGGLLERASHAGKRTVVLAGSIDDTLQLADVTVLPITPPGTPLPEALAHAERNLAAALARHFASPANRG